MGFRGAAGGVSRHGGRGFEARRGGVSRGGGNGDGTSRDVRGTSRHGDMGQGVKGDIFYICVQQGPNLLLTYAPPPSCEFSPDIIGCTMDHACAIFFRSLWCKDLKNNVPRCLTCKYTNKHTQIQLRPNICYVFGEPLV